MFERAVRWLENHWRNDDTDDGGIEHIGQEATEECAWAQFGYFPAALRNQATDGTNLDADGRKVGEASEGKRGDQDGFIAKFIDAFTECGVANELVEDGLLADEVTHLEGLVPWRTNKPGRRGEDYAKESFERPVILTEEGADAAEDGRKHHDRGDEGDKQAGNRDGDLSASHGTATDGVDDVLGFVIADVFNGGVEVRLFCFRHEALGDEQGSRRIHERCGEQVLQGCTQERIADQCGSGYGGKAADHTGIKFGSGELGQVGLNYQRCLGLPEEDHGGGPDRFHLGGAHEPFDGGSDVFHEVLNNPKVVQGGYDGAQEDDHGEHIEGEDKVVTEEATEDELGALVGKVRELCQPVGDALEGLESRLPRED